jgi:hypothetical protein
LTIVGTKYCCERVSQGLQPVLAHSSTSDDYQMRQNV